MRVSQIECLEFSGCEYDPVSGKVHLRYALHAAGEVLALEEQFAFGPCPVPPGREAALESALDLLHWIAGVSYWKIACRGQVRFTSRGPDEFQARALEQIYQHGLAELAWQNGLQGRYWPRFNACLPHACGSPASAGLADRVLLPLGGGKDSLVVLERLRAHGAELETVQVGAAPRIGEVAATTGYPHHVIGRRLAPELAGLNRAGALNGHVPITAINAAVLIVMALLRDFNAVVFANERSADVPTRASNGQPGVNHQYAKSFAFENLLAQWIRKFIAPDLEVFSLIRRWSELSVCREFAALSRYHDVFSSCNRNFHMDGPRTERWCGDCPKCRFVFLGLAPFLPRTSLLGIFGRDLLDDPGQYPGFAELLEIDGSLRPFECVGEALESRAAVQMLAGMPQWRDHALIARLQSGFRPLEVRQICELMAPAGPDRVPERFRACA